MGERERDKGEREEREKEKWGKFREALLKTPFIDLASAAAVDPMLGFRLAFFLPLLS